MLLTCIITASYHNNNRIYAISNTSKSHLLTPVSVVCYKLSHEEHEGDESALYQISQRRSS